MDFKETAIKGVYIIEPRVFNDARGYFFEAWKQAEFEEHIGKVNFVQDNESKSSRGVLRGLHYQKGDYSQAKLVRVIKGCVLDVAVDIAPQADAGIRWNDPALGIEWPIDPKEVLTSEKDLKQPLLKDAECFE